MTMDDKYAEDIWMLLKIEIQKILKKEDTSQISREELYR